MTQVAPHTHETDTHLFYGPVDAGQSDATDYDGLDFYHAVLGTLINDGDGYIETGAVIEGESADIGLGYSDCAIAPRPSDPLDVDRLKEADLHVDLEGQRKVNFNISPRSENQRHYENGERLTFPFNHTDAEEGVTVHAQASNIDLDELPHLFSRALFEAFDEVGKGLYHGYVDGPFGGNITAVERYVRYQRSYQPKLIGTGGVLDRMTMLLPDVEGTAGEYKWDNEDEFGHRHALKHGSQSARELCSRHRLGGQVKSYLPENPENFEPDDALYHPKLGVKFVQKWNRNGAVSWADRHDLVRELDERMLSILSWADVPTESGGTTYVADDHFDASAADETVPLHADPLPQLEAEQEHLLLTCLRDMTPADEAIAETLATDGGMHADRLAEATGTSLSTVYRALQRIPEVLESDNGHVQFVSEKLRQEMRALVDSVESTIDSAGERAARVLDLNVRQSASSAFDLWLAKYGAEFEAPDHEGERPVVRIDTVLSTLKSTHQPLVEDAIVEMLQAWRKDGRDPATLLDAMLEVTIDGARQKRPVRTLH